MKTKKTRSLFILSLLMIFIISWGMVSASQDTQDITEIADDSISVDEKSVLSDGYDGEDTTEDEFDVKVVEDPVPTYYEDSVINITVPKNTEGKITLNMKYEEYDGNIDDYIEKEWTNSLDITAEDSKLYLSLSDLEIYNPNNYDILITFNSEQDELELYEGYLNVYKIPDEYDFHTIIADVPIRHLTDNAIEFVIPYMAEGKVIVKVNNEYFDDVEINESTFYSYCIVNLVDLNICADGTYFIEVIWNKGNQNISLASNNVEVELLKPEIEICNVNKLDDEDYFVSVRFHNPVSGNLIITLGENVIYNKTISYSYYWEDDENEIFVRQNELTNPLDWGEYTIEAKIVDGDNIIVNETGSFLVTCLFVYDDGPYYYVHGSEIGVQIIIPSDAEGKIIISYNGKTKEVNSWNEYDEAYTTISTDDLKDGENTIVATFITSNEEKYPTMSNNFTVIVLQNTDDVKVNVNTDVEEGTNVIVKITAPESDTNASIFLDGVCKGNVSLIDGEGTLDLGALSVGTHQVRVEYETYYGEDIESLFYGNFTVTVSAKAPAKTDNQTSQNSSKTDNTPTVPPKTETKIPTVASKPKITLKKVTIKKSAKKLVIQATVKLNGKPVASKKITFKFNGKKYTAKTNKNGIAKITIKKNVLKKLKVGKKVKYQATYLKTTATQNIKVKK